MDTHFRGEEIMKPMRCGNFLVAFAVLAGLLQPELARSEVADPDPSARAAYQQALKHEEEQARLYSSARLAYNRASAAREAARKHERALEKLHGEAQARAEAFERAPKAARQCEERARIALEAIAAYSRAADRALRAATAFAEARGSRRAKQARAADAAAEARAQALLRAQEAVTAAERANDALRSALSSVAYRSRSVGEGLALVRKTADALAAKSAESGVQPGDQVARLHDEAKTLAGRLKLARDLSDEMTLAQSQLPAGLVQGYFEASLDAAIEAEARGYMAAVREASAGRCKAGSACRSRLEAELADADALLAATRDEADGFARTAAAIPDSASSTGRRIEEYADVARNDPQTVAAAAAAAGTTEKFAARAEEAALADYRRASAAYDEARRAADAAHVAAYGEPRQGEKEMAAAMAAPSPKPAYEMAASMAAPAWQVETHAWEFFTKTAAESRGYGAYTYVLFGWRLGSRLAPQVERNYAALLDAVITTTKHRTEVSPAIPPAKQNLFCIPGMVPLEQGLDALFDEDKKFPALDNYASSLALSILSGAGAGVVRSPEILGVIQDSPGPFLLTTLQPIRQAKSGSPMLFVDLSRFPADAYADLLTAYKQALVAGPPQVQRTWQPSAFQWAASTGTGIAGHLVKVKGAVKDWFSFGAGKPAKVAAR